MFLTEVKITVILILRSKTRICRKINFETPFSFDRHNTSIFLFVYEERRVDYNKCILCSVN